MSSQIDRNSVNEKQQRKQPNKIHYCFLDNVIQHHSNMKNHIMDCKIFCRSIIYILVFIRTCNFSSIMKCTISDRFVCKKIIINLTDIYYTLSVLIYQDNIWMDTVLLAQLESYMCYSLYSANNGPSILV